MAVVDVWRREVGELTNRKFTLSLGASELYFRHYHILLRNSINGVKGGRDGFIVLYKIILWDWETGLPKLTFKSGHACVYNFFRARFMPYSGNRSLITCASDGQLVRHARISECGVETKLVAKHQGRTYNLAVEAGNPHLVYTCGEDGLVQHSRSNVSSLIHIQLVSIASRYGLRRPSMSLKRDQSESLFYIHKDSNLRHT
ncbi:hypothetical protein GQ457_12G032590 [Hibiscus cannabinus]